MQPVPVLVAVDLVVLTIRDESLAALVIRRGIAPYAGRWALPGGFIRPGEDVTAAAQRELTEETGLPADAVHLEQLATYGRPDRDPRERVISVAYLALAPDLPIPAAGGDAADARWAQVAELSGKPSRLAFDHARILADGVERARAKLEYTSLATSFCGPEFTVTELRHVYEVVWGVDLDPRNFHRKVTGTPGFLTATGRKSNTEGGRPAQLFRRGEATLLHPPMLRGE